MDLSFDITVADDSAEFVKTFAQMAGARTVNSKGVGLTQITAMWSDKDKDNPTVEAGIQPDAISIVRSLLLCSLQAQGVVVRISPLKVAES